MRQPLQVRVREDEVEDVREPGMVEHRWRHGLLASSGWSGGECSNGSRWTEMDASE